MEIEEYKWYKAAFKKTGQMTTEAHCFRGTYKKPICRQNIERCEPELDYIVAVARAKVARAKEGEWNGACLRCQQLYLEMIDRQYKTWESK